jgi:hypothetical protein
MPPATPRAACRVRVVRGEAGEASPAGLRPIAGPYYRYGLGSESRDYPSVSSRHASTLGVAGVGRHDQDDLAKIDRDENYNGRPDDLEKLPRLPWPEDTQNHNIACGEVVPVSGETRYRIACCATYRSRMPGCAPNECRHGSSASSRTARSIAASRRRAIRPDPGCLSHVRIPLRLRRAAGATIRRRRTAITGVISSLV